jgi:ribosomal RNA-processing protein 7
MLSGYLNHHALRFPPTTTLQASIDAYMTAFASQEASRARLLTRQRAEPDEDGFVTVTRGGRMGPARQEEAQEKADAQKEKQKGKEDFYRFQMREKRKEKANELLKGFEEDRKKVEAMKMKRNKFRPN